MTPTNPNADARFRVALTGALPVPELLPLANGYLIGPFDNKDLAGRFAAYPPEKEINLKASYPGLGMQVGWRRTPGLDGINESVINFSAWYPTDPNGVMYYLGEVNVKARTAAQISLECQGLAQAWVNGTLIIASVIPDPINYENNVAWVILEPGVNQILVKMMFQGASQQGIGIHVSSYGSYRAVIRPVRNLVASQSVAHNRLMARLTLAELLGAARDVKGCKTALAAIRQDPYATPWDKTWADAVERQFTETGSFAPFHDVGVRYQPVTSVQPYPEFWPQSTAPARELLVVDVSNALPQDEFAMAVLQGLVNRKQPRLYLLHTRYARQDSQWLDELIYEGYSSRQISIDEAWQQFKPELKGVVIYDGDIMNEIGAVYSDQLNQTNVLMMIGALEDAVPLTAQMNAALGLPVVFDSRGKWTDQYDMMRWAYINLFPKMNPRILATNYPGIFLITDYLVSNRIFTFWFPEHRTTLEENLLRGILASTPPNSPILGWWFDWLPNPQDPVRFDADAVMEWPGLLRGSYFGKILTPSHEATNLSVHSGVPSGGYKHKVPERPELDPSKIYYTFMISDGDNMGEALMMRTRDLQWDRPERGAFPMGWSFAPATSHLAPPVLSYYLRTATPNDVLMGGLGVGYTEPIIYLRAYPEQREALWEEYARSVDKAIGWIDSHLLWLIDGRHEEADRYARGSSGQLKGIFIGYGGAPDIAEARITANNVVAFYPATRFHSESMTNEEKINAIVSEIQAGTRGHPDFIEAWLLNWGLEMSMLLEVQRQLGPDYVCVRPDVLVDLRRQAT